MKTPILVFVLGLAFCSSSRAADGDVAGGHVRLVKEEKASLVWSFAWENRSLRIEASISPQLGGQNFNVSVLSDSGANFKPREVAAAVEYVVQRLPDRGFPKASIQRVFLSSIMVDEWRARLKNAAHDSGEWKSWLQKRSASDGSEGSRIVVSILNNAHVFRELEATCRSLGLGIVVQSVEEVLTDSATDLRLPESAMVWIGVSPCIAPTGRIETSKTDKAADAVSSATKP